MRERARGSEGEPGSEGGRESERVREGRRKRERGSERERERDRGRRNTCCIRTESGLRSLLTASADGDRRSWVDCFSKPLSPCPTRSIREHVLFLS